MTVSSASADDLTIRRFSRCSDVSVGVEHEIGHADDAVHRRADLVAHVRQELALGLVGGLGGVLGRAQFGFRLVALGDVLRNADAAHHFAVLDVEAAHVVQPSHRAVGPDRLGAGPRNRRRISRPPRMVSSTDARSSG